MLPLKDAFPIRLGVILHCLMNLMNLCQPVKGVLEISYSQLKLCIQMHICVSMCNIPNFPQENSRREKLIIILIHSYKINDNKEIELLPVSCWTIGPLKLNLQKSKVSVNSCTMYFTTYQNYLGFI